jgi:hypothetical protein
LRPSGLGRGLGAVLGRLRDAQSHETAAADAPERYVGRPIRYGNIAVGTRRRYILRLSNPSPVPLEILGYHFSADAEPEAANRSEWADEAADRLAFRLTPTRLTDGTGADAAVPGYDSPCVEYPHSIDAPPKPASLTIPPSGGEVTYSLALSGASPGPLRAVLSVETAAERLSFAVAGTAVAGKLTMQELPLRLAPSFPGTARSQSTYGLGEVDL